MKYAYEEYYTSGIGDHNSVSNGPDDGANNGMAKCFWKCMRHGTTAQAVSNYLGRLQVADASSGNFEDYGPDDAQVFKGAGNLNIGGHGNEGLLETGVGQNGSFDLNKYILTWNIKNWGPELQKLKPKNFTMLSIYSCHSGAGADGAQLLWLMANELQRAVRGRTGFTYTNGEKVWFEDGSVWQVATPGPTPPTAIPAPTPHLWEGAEMGMKMVSDGKNIEIPYSDVVRIEVQAQNQIMRTTSVNTYAGSEAEDVARLLFGSEPFPADAQPMGFITATVKIQFKAESEPREFAIHNDRLIEDLKAKVFYYTNQGVAKFLSTI